MTIKMNVIVPLGPHEEIIQRNLPLSHLLPRPLFPIGGRPMLWHVLNQLSLIKERINKIYLCVNHTDKDKGRTCNFLENYEKIYNLSDIDKELKQKTEIKTYEEKYAKLILDIIGSSEIPIIHHLHDMIFPTGEKFKENTRKAYTGLIDSFTNNNNDITGTFLVSNVHRIHFGFVAHDTTHVIGFKERKKERKEDTVESAYIQGFSISENMGVIIFNSNKLRNILSKHKDLTTFYLYDAIEKEIEKENKRTKGDVPSYNSGHIFSFSTYAGMWFHVDNLHELREINSSYAKYFPLTF